MADPVQLTEQDIAKIVQPIINALNAPGAVKQFIAKAEGEASAVVTKVKSISWSHVYAVVASTAAVALHFVKYLP